MRIVPKYTCNECCFCIEDYDNNGLCCKDNIYKTIKLNQYACKSFCNDEDNNYNYYNNNHDFDEEDDDQY